MITLSNEMVKFFLLNVIFTLAMMFTLINQMLMIIFVNEMGMITI